MHLKFLFRLICSKRKMFNTFWRFDAVFFVFTWGMDNKKKGSKDQLLCNEKLLVVQVWSWDLGSWIHVCCWSCWETPNQPWRSLPERVLEVALRWMNWDLCSYSSYGVAHERGGEWDPSVLVSALISFQFIVSLLSSYSKRDIHKSLRDSVETNLLKAWLTCVPAVYNINIFCI